MANWYGSARSNYFAVKDPAAFKAWVETMPSLDLIERDGKFGFLDNSGEGWPSFRDIEVEGGEEEVDVDLLAELSEYLAEGEVAVLMLVGAEKLRYLTGWAGAVSWKGEIVDMNLGEIYTRAETAFGVRPTCAEY